MNPQPASVKLVANVRSRQGAQSIEKARQQLSSAAPQTIRNSITLIHPTQTVLPDQHQPSNQGQEKDRCDGRNSAATPVSLTI